MIKNYFNFINESKEEKSYYKSTNLIQEICISMVLVNNSFLDNLLDRNLKARYTESSRVFLTDLKNMLLAKNKLSLGKFIDNKCVTDEEISKVNGLFDSVNFNIEEDWNKLINSRITARNIIDKLLPDGKVTEDMVVAVYWIGPNKSKENDEDIVLELTDGRQYSFYLNKNISVTKTASFNTLADDLIGNEIDNLHNQEYIKKWNKLVQQWVRIIYDNCNKNMQIHIEKFIDEDKIDFLDWFKYFELTHRDPRFRHLGEFIKEFDKNILYFSDLMSSIWKNRDKYFMDVERVYNEWMENKVYILNSKILEHIFTESITKNNIDEVQKLDDGFKSADGKIKMKIIKTLVDKLGCSERTTYYLGSNGNIFNQIPSRQFFRDFYDSISVSFDYHVKMLVDENEENNDFNIKVRLEIDSKPLMNFDIIVKFTGGDISEKLSAKYKFELPDNFNRIVSKKNMPSNNEDI